MKHVLAAFGYHARRTAGNRARAILGRLRRPRYLIGFLLAATYLWVFLIRPVSGDTADPQNARWLRLGVQIFYLLNLLTAWIFGAFGRGIMFREAEVELLFPAPLRRPQILLFKLMQAQFGLIVTALVFGAIIDRTLPERPFVLTAFAIWLAGNTLYVHSVFANLTLKSLAARGGPMKALVWLPASLVVLVVFVSVWMAQVEIGGLEVVADVERLLEAGPLRILLAPVRFLADFILVAAGLHFVLGSLAVVAAGALLAAFTVAADHRFEDQALKTARMMSRLKKDGAAGLSDPGKQVLKGSARGFPALAPLGPTWRALVWKNVVSVGRLPRTTVRLIFVLIPFVVAIFVFGRGALSEGKTLAAVSFMLLVVAIYGSLLGPALLRVDLRLDLLHFDVLKSLPIRGRDLLLGEVLGPCLIIFLAQLVLVGLGLYFFPTDLIDWLDWRRKIIGFVIAMPFLFAFDFALFSLENLMALHLPSFVRFGRGMKGGFDQFGQNLLGAIVRGLALTVFILPSLLIGGGLGLLLGLLGSMPIEMIVFLSVLLGSLVLVFVAYGLLVLSERRYERFDLSAESLGVET